MDGDGSQPLVAISNRQEISLDVDGLRELAVSTLRAEGIEEGELSIAFVPEDEIADLHERYLGEPGPTDVLSFPQDEPGEPGEPRLLGDVVIWPGYAAAQARDVAAELRLLVVHGILHLLGYDHEDDAERRRMWDRQETYSGMRP